MAGRSPYLGAAMYVAYLISNFWLFVIAQAALAYLLIVLAIQRIGLADHAVTPIVLFLSVTTALPTYNSLLLADAFASFGILSFLLLATPGKLSRKKTVGLTAVLCASSMFHLTHIMMLLGMVGALSAVSFLNIAPVALTRAAATGAIGLIAGVLSIQATSVVTTMVLGRPPQLLPLLTARFVADGPGLSYIDSECEKRFQVCRVRIGRDLNNATFLFSPDVAHGTYALLNSEERSRMGREDTQFALAVWKSYPLDESYMIFRNTVRQIAWIDYDGLNQNCFANSNCWNALPTNVRQTLRRSLSGRGMWPQQAMNFLLYVVVLGSICYLVVNYRHFQKLAPETEKVMRMWLIIGGAAMVVCAVFGGAVADPQYRYQGRLIWLIPLFAALIFLKSRSLVYIGRRQDSI